MDFADAEVLKFGYIFILWSIFNLLHSYLESQIWMYLEPHSDRYYVWRSPQIPAFALMLATANFLNNFRKHYFQLKSKNQSFGRMQKNQLESEAALAALHARVNPHFLYNALNSIASLAKEDAEKTEKMALALSTFYKYNTNRNEEHWATIAEELNILANYLTIEQIRFDEQLIINYEIEEGIKKYLIPKFMLQPLVENGIKYGFDEKSNKIIVTIKIIKQQGQLLICIFDKGLPFSDTLQLGYGLRSVQKKLKLFYPDQHSLTLVNEPEKGIMITLPMLRDTKK
jgi:LytS/YehU family sensor histidine kinase